MKAQRKPLRRMTALAMAAMMLFTFAFPAMAYEPPVNVTNITDYGSSNSEGSASSTPDLGEGGSSTFSRPENIPGGELTDPPVDPENNSSSSDPSDDALLPDHGEAEPPELDSGVPLPPEEDSEAKDPLTVGASGLDPPDLVTFEVQTGRVVSTRGLRAAPGSATIYLLSECGRSIMRRLSPFLIFSRYMICLKNTCSSIMTFSSPLKSSLRRIRLS